MNISGRPPRKAKSTRSGFISLFSFGKGVLMWTEVKRAVDFIRLFSNLLFPADKGPGLVDRRLTMTRAELHS